MLCAFCVFGVVCIYITRIWFYTLVYARARVPFPEWIRDLGAISGSLFAQFRPTVWPSSKVSLPRLSFFFFYNLFRLVSHFPVIRRFRPRLRCPFVFFFSFAYFRSDYINNYLSITFMLHFGFPFNATIRSNRLAPLGICPRQHTGLHQVIHTPSCLRRLLFFFFKYFLQDRTSAWIL